ncbi:NAD(P)/FAD-dependent oxidoreductase [Candidatus Amarolinea aalborgensis]|jgi:predicted NAD/FAD-dependent oxidoreductase|uniref:NAD(P)/FAD-dependent oxidoreductase n=1 Tax=Candidatus Amarolinea aalborgensis TaxID=2249329 RepID=UPI003BFA2E23
MDYDVLVVGAGMTGLMAALRLHALGQRVRLVDKGRSVGGRMATRRVGPGFADFGAQFITAHDAGFADLLARWEEAGLIHPWAAGFAQGSLRPSPDVVFYPRYVARDGMTSLAEHLAHGLDVQTQVTVKAVRQVQGGWQVEDAAGGLTLARRVLLTPPVPQSLALLAAGHVELSAADQAALASITYDPCLVGLFWLQGEIFLPPPGALMRSHHDLFWIADNQEKGISPDATLITVQTSPAFARRLWEADDADILAEIHTSLQEFLAPQSVVVEAYLKRWRFATVASVYPRPYLLPSGLPGLALAGDAFGVRSGLEGAVFSGQQAAEALAAA